MDATLVTRLAELTQLAATALDVPIAAVNLVSARDVRVLTAVGLATGLTMPAGDAFCSRTAGGREPLVVTDALADERFAGLPMVAGGSVRFYAGWPISTRTGLPIGTLCVMAPTPRTLSGPNLRTMGLLARHAESYLRADAGGSEADRLRDDFVALVSHEVRTPLAAIQGYVEMLLDELPSAEDRHQKFAGSIEANVRRLVRLIDQLLLTASAAGGALVLRQEAVDLREVAAAALDAVAELAATAGVTLGHRVVGPALTLVGDRNLLVDAVDNLVRNGVRFTPAGGRVELLVGGEPGVVEVVDSGVGIPAEERDRVFDRFFRGAYAQMHAVPGAGLGLALVKAVAEAHGGAVLLEHPATGGTSVMLQLPNAA